MSILLIQPTLKLNPYRFVINSPLMTWIRLIHGLKFQCQFKCKYYCSGWILLHGFHLKWMRSTFACDNTLSFHSKKVKYNLSTMAKFSQLFLSNLLFCISYRFSLLVDIQVKMWPSHHLFVWMLCGCICWFFHLEIFETRK